MKIYFSRHGQSQANLLRELSCQGLKHPLTAQGREQAQELAQRLTACAITRIYSSPLLRAIETTVIVANQLGVDYEVTEALREYSLGYLEGRGDEEAWKLWQQLFDDWTLYQRYDNKIEGGESFHDVRERFIPFVEGLVRQYRHTQANLLCVGHGGLYWMMLPLVLVNIDTAAIDRLGGFDYTTIIAAEPGPGGLICTEWNGVRLAGRA